MRTTLVLDDELLAKAEEYTGISNKSALVRESLKKLVERRPPAGWRVSAVASPSSSRSRGGGRNVGDLVHRPAPGGECCPRPPP